MSIPLNSVTKYPFWGSKLLKIKNLVFCYLKVTKYEQNGNGNKIIKKPILLLFCYSMVTKSKLLILKELDIFCYLKEDVYKKIPLVGNKIPAGRIYPAISDSGGPNGLNLFVQLFDCLSLKLVDLIEVIRHFSKAFGGQALAKIAGSHQWAAAARVVFGLGQEKRSDRRILVPLKFNIPVSPKSLAFRIDSIEIEQDGQYIKTSIPEFEQEEEEIDADELFLDFSMLSKTARAERFLRQIPSGGGLDIEIVEAEARKLGLSEFDLKNARRKLGVIAQRKVFGPDGKSILRLPEHLRGGNAK